MATPEGPELPVPLPFPLLLDEAVRQVRRALPTLYLPFALATAVLGALAAAIQMLLRPSAGAAADPMQAMAAGCMTSLVALPLAFLSMILSAAMGQAAVQFLLTGRAALGSALRFALRPGVVATELLVGLCVLVSALACLVPVLFVGPMLGLVIPAMAAEGVLGTGALSRSAQLTRYNPAGTLLASPRLKVLATFAVSFAISLLIGSLIEVPVLALQGGTIVRRLAAGQNVQQAMVSWSQVPLRAAGAFLSTPVELFLSFALALLFFDLRARREGDDLSRAIAALSAGLAPPPVTPETPPRPLPPLPAPPFPLPPSRP